MKTLPWLKHSFRIAFAGVLLTQASGTHLRAAEGNSIVWHQDSNTIDVDIDNKPLSAVVTEFKNATGREIHVPAGMTKTVSLKFSGKPMSEGVAKILDGFNYYGETHGNESRIVVVDPNGSPPVPVGVRPTMVMPRPTAPGGNRPPGGGPGGFGSGPGGLAGGRGDSRGGGSTSGDRTKRSDAERAAMELIMREAGMKGGGSDRGSYSRGSGSGGGTSSGKSRSPR